MASRRRRDPRRRTGRAHHHRRRGLGRRPRRHPFRPAQARHDRLHGARRPQWRRSRGSRRRQPRGPPQQRDLRRLRDVVVLRGAVAVLLASADPSQLVTTAGRQVLDITTAGNASALDFGNALETGDLDGDGRDELCAATGNGSSAGSVVVVHFEAGRGIRADASRAWEQGPGQVTGGYDRTDGFAETLKAGQYGGSGATDSPSRSRARTSAPPPGVRAVRVGRQPHRDRPAALEPGLVRDPRERRGRRRLRDAGPLAGFAGALLTSHWAQVFHVHVKISCYPRQICRGQEQFFTRT